MVEKLPKCRRVIKIRTKENRKHENKGEIEKSGWKGREEQGGGRTDECSTRNRRQVGGTRASSESNIHEEGDGSRMEAGPPRVCDGPGSIVSGRMMAAVDNKPDKREGMEWTRPGGADAQGCLEGRGKRIRRGLSKAHDGSRVPAGGSVRVGKIDAMSPRDTGMKGLTLARVPIYVKSKLECSDRGCGGGGGWLAPEKGEVGTIEGRGGVESPRWVVRRESRWAKEEMLGGREGGTGGSSDAGSGNDKRTEARVSASASRRLELSSGKDQGTLAAQRVSERAMKSPHEPNNAGPRTADLR
nr:hypothetical protein Iba_chr05dCG7940 [Ipomoea batatas]